MRWFDNKINNLKSTRIPYEIHGINDEIYDEIVLKPNGYCYLIKRCGTMPFTFAHNFTDFKTDGTTIVYPLPESEQKEIKLDWMPPNVFGDNSTFVISSGGLNPEITATLSLDRRYKETRGDLKGVGISLNDPLIDKDRKIYVEEIYGTEEGLGEPIVDEEGNEQYEVKINTSSHKLTNIFYNTNATSSENISLPFLNTVNVRESRFTVEFGVEESYTNGGVLGFLDNGNGFRITYEDEKLHIHNFNTDEGVSRKEIQCEAGDTLAIVYDGVLKVYVNGIYTLTSGWIWEIGEFKVAQNISFLRVYKTDIPVENLVVGDVTATTQVITSPVKLYKTENMVDKIAWNESKGCYQLRVSTEENIYKYISLRTQDQKKTISLFEEGDTIVSSSNADIVLNVPYREIRELITPQNFRAIVSTDSDLVRLEWDNVLGASEYEIYLDNEKIDTVPTLYWETREETVGYLKVRAVNDVTVSEFTEAKYVISTPNETYLTYVNNKYENNRYVFDIHFPDLSNIETGYKIGYIIDDRDERFEEVEGRGGTGEVITHTITVPVITERVRLRVISVNETGENNVTEPVELRMTAAPKWAYKNETKTVLVSWINAFEGATEYVAKIKVNGGEEELIHISAEGMPVGARMIHYFDLLEDDTMELCLAGVMDGIYHIYSQPITISKALDKTLAPPRNFRYTKISESEIEFTWYDDYDCEDGFEFTYSISNSSPITITIPSTSVTGTGRRYSYVYTFEEHGFINAKVRMAWELGVSEYTEEAIIYYVPATGLPPAYIRRESLDGHIKLQWEGQQYVNKYILHKKIGTKEETVELSDNSYSFDIDYNMHKPFGNALDADSKWTVKKYPKTKYSNARPAKQWIEGLEPLITVKKPANGNLTENWGTDFIAHAETYVYVERDVTIQMQAACDDNGEFYVNNVSVSKLTTATRTFDANLREGWNRLEYFVHQAGGGYSMNFGKFITTYFEIKKISSEIEVVPFSIDISVSTKFLNEVVSEKSKVMTFYPCYSENLAATTINTKVNIPKIMDTNIYTPIDKEMQIDTKSINKDTAIKYPFIEKSYTKYLTTEGPIGMTTSGRGLATEFPVQTRMTQKNVRLSEYPATTMSIKKTALDNLIHSTVATKTGTDYLINMEINKVRIMTIGDSITAGHPGHWAETMTGDERSQYQYWLNRRLKNQFEILNKGYGSDTTDKMLARFDKDVLSYNASYCIIQGGTNDLYWAMAESDGDQAALDMKLSVMKGNIQEMVKRCWDNNIHPIVGTLIPRTGAVGIYKQALYDFNEWIIMFCSTNENVDYIDFFNAGKDAFPPTPLEDPLNPGALNPIYDGDAIYDEFGNLIKQGRGIHPNIEGYKIMGEAIPLSLFRTTEEGMKLYVDKDCTIEEKFDDTDKLHPFYTLTVDNIRRGTTKRIVRHVKNIGSSQAMFAVFATNEHSVTVHFIDEKGNKLPYSNGLLAPGMSATVTIEFNVLNEDTYSSVDLHIASRKLA